MLGALVIMLLAVVAAVAVFEFFQLRQLQRDLDAARVETGNAKTAAFELRQKNTDLRTQIAIAEQESPAQTQLRILKEVAGLHKVPETEVPTMALVTDTAKLASEPFFANAENGDYIIMYREASISVLYRPSEKRIINAGTIASE